MNSVCKDIFRSIHEGKWLSIEYKNKQEIITKYWIAIKDININCNLLKVDGLHIGQLTITEFDIHIESILSSSLIDGSYCEKNEELIYDISLNHEKYQHLFNNIANLKILNYLSDCNRMDCTPYKCEYSLIEKIDLDILENGSLALDKAQFESIVKEFQNKSSNNSSKFKIKNLCMNILSINTPKGLYVLAYKKLQLDVKNRLLKTEDNITISNEFTINGEKQSIRQFLDAEDYYLVENFTKNSELIKDRITFYSKLSQGVDDMPYIIGIGKDITVDLNYEYNGILDMYEKNDVTYPIKGFFGDITARPIRIKNFPIVLLNKKVNIDQLLAINTSIKYPIAYVQGPPGTGKTNTIINTISTAFFNEKTVLFTSYNNHPIDGVFAVLQNIKYKEDAVPFPILRIGNNTKVIEALKYMKNIYEKTKNINIYESTLEKNKTIKINDTAELTELLKKYDGLLELKERKETIEKLLENNKNLSFNAELQGSQLYSIKKEIDSIGEITTEHAMSLLAENEEDYIKYLYYTSSKYIKRIDESQNKELLDIIYMENEEEAVAEFNRYIGIENNLKKLIRIFPIIATTCISSHRLAEPKPYFDIVIMDEASQCNNAISLVPIIRGKQLMLVGDPQQLNPVILLDPRDNDKLRKNYRVSEEYDYLHNSIYKTYLACDTVSDEILLSHHYRCHKDIIEFNNRKYYNNKLKIESKNNFPEPLMYINIKQNKTYYKNTAPYEVDKILEIIRKNKDKQIGVITPFADQKILINEKLCENNISNVTCGTVHAFQGDEKDIIIFSLALTEQTNPKTYNWLKSNKELINVATSRAKDQLIMISSDDQLARLTNNSATDDIYELVQYVKTKGRCEITPETVNSRALGIKPYSTQTEEAFMENLNHALDNVLPNKERCVIHKEVPISHIFNDNYCNCSLFYSGRFDFVVYEKNSLKQEMPVFAIELDGKEHFDDEMIKLRDEKKNAICKEHGFDLIRIKNTYARRYNHIKDILLQYFKNIK